MTYRRPTELHVITPAVWTLLLALLGGPLWAQGGDAKLAPRQGPVIVPEVTPVYVDPEARDASEVIGDPAPQEPPDGKWLKDEGGREHFIWRIAKEGLKYQEIAGDTSRVRVNHFQVYELDSQDGEALYVRIFRVIPGENRNRMIAGEPTPEDLEKAAATYLANLPVVDTLSFRSFDRGLPKRGHWRNGFELADMNEDGHLDLVHCPPRKGGSQPIIFLGDGTGNWQIWNEMRFPPAAYDYGDVSVADFNADGHQDMALGIHLRGMLVLVGDGKGRFDLWTEGIDLEIPGRGGSATTFSSRQVEAIDWNGDEYPDIVALGEGPRPATKNSKDVPGLLVSFSYGVIVYINKGDGSWEKTSLGNEQGEIFGDDLKLADFDGNGRMDFATSSSAMMRRDLLNLNQGDGTWKAMDLAGVRPFSYVRAVEAGDYDGDGKSDLVVGYTNRELKVWRTGIDLFLARPDGEWERRPLFSEESRRGFFALAGGDVDGNSARDLVAINGDGELFMFLGDGNGGFQREENAELSPPSKGCRGYAVRLVDVDGDGKDELLANFAGERNAMFAPDRCLSNGGLMAWKVMSAEEAESARLDSKSR